MAKNRLRMTVDRVRAATDTIRSLGAGRVLVGIPAANALRTPEPGEDPGVNNALLGYVHQNGSPAKNIPARPFLPEGVRDVQEQIADTLEAAARKQLSGRGEAADVTLHKVGLIAQAGVRKRLVDGPFVPLAPKTLAARRRKGRTGTKPLNDTGQLRNAINYVVEE